MKNSANLIIDSVEAVTKKWTKQRKSEERRAAAATNRRHRLTSTRGPSIKCVAWQIMKDAYLEASGGGGYHASARQVYYPARRMILPRTGETSLNSHYFTQKLLPEYIARHPRETADWDVTYDARGHLTEPHTKLIVPLGTVDVRDYVAKIASHVPGPVGNRVVESDYPTMGPRDRFGAVLFIEKEGFLPLFEQTKLAERFDIAIMSTKGMPVVACRQLADELCGRYGVPLLVLHDFDKAGFSILGTLKGVAHYDRECNERDERYKYRHDFPVIDLGIRLEDVQQYNLESEPVDYKGDPADNLEQNGATKEEVAFLVRGRQYGYGKYQGERVELNAFTSDKFVEWIERKLKKHGIKKLVPDAKTAEVAYHRGLEIAIINKRLETVKQEAEGLAGKAEPPKGLVPAIRKWLAKNPELPWDQAVAEIATAAAKDL